MEDYEEIVQALYNGVADNLLNVSAEQVEELSIWMMIIFLASRIRKALQSPPQVLACYHLSQ